MLPCSKVALWNQKVKPSNDAVVWDYHVILLIRFREADLRERAPVWIYDFDTRLAVPCKLQGCVL